MNQYVANEAVCFDDILLIPQESGVDSRSNVDLFMEVGVEERPGCKLRLNLPIIAAPMDTVCDENVAREMYDAGGLGIIHRYSSQEKIINQIKKLRSDSVPLYGISVSTSDCFDIEYIGRILSLQVPVICIDTANGHNVQTVDAVRHLRRLAGNDYFHIMTGNVSTLRGYENLIEAGADSVRVGIGGGAACTTRIVSGHGMPTLQSILDCSSSDYGGIIADGGIKNTGDMVKSFAAGASAVMIGSLLAGHKESPKVYDDEGNLVYRGMASGAAQKDWRGSFNSEEGVVGTIPARGRIADTLKSMSYGIASGCSYTGSFRLSELSNRARYARVSPLSVNESRPRV